MKESFFNKLENLGGSFCKKELYSRRNHRNFLQFQKHAKLNGTVCSSTWKFSEILKTPKKIWFRVHNRRSPSNFKHFLNKHKKHLSWSQFSLHLTSHLTFMQSIYHAI